MAGGLRLAELAVGRVDATLGAALSQAQRRLQSLTRLDVVFYETRTGPAFSLSDLPALLHRDSPMKVSSPSPSPMPQCHAVCQSVGSSAPSSLMFVAREPFIKWPNA